MLIYMYLLCCLVMTIDVLSPSTFNGENFIE